jgi:hypothetical protein
MPTYLIAVDPFQGKEHWMVCEFVRPELLETGIIREFDNGNRVIIDRAVIEKWAREIAAEKLGDLVTVDDFAPKGSKSVVK